MAAPVVKMFPAVVYMYEENWQEDTEYELRHEIFGVRIPLKSNRCLLMGKRGRYYQDRPSLLEYLASLQTSPILPEVLIVDDIDFYASHPKTQDISSTAAMLCAYLIDTATFIDTHRSKDGRNHHCLLMVSVAMTNNGEVALEHVYQSFLPAVLRIIGVTGTDDIYQLSLHPNGTSQSSCTITYEIKDNIRLLDYNAGMPHSVFHKNSHRKSSK